MALSLYLVATVAARCMTAAVADYDAIAGYVPVSDVVPHSLLDLDMQEIDEGVDLFSAVGFANAYTAYSEGGNSEKTTSTRTIQNFSLEAQEKLTGEKWFDIYENYWGSPTYADDFTAAACQGTDTFEDASFETRAEGCIKGAQYQNVWMYVIHELEDAVGDCRIGELDANDGGPHAWDEGWAFYAGSLEGTDGSGSGFMLHELATKRCANFGTCTADSDGSDIDGTSQINADMLELYNEGQVNLLSGDCDGAEAVKDRIVNLMTVPLVQGALRYFYKADPEGEDGGDKEAAELWAFSAAILPRVYECDEDVAVTLRANTDINSADAPMSEGYRVLKEKLESVYSCMGISCSQVGGLVIGESLTFYEGMEACSDSDSGGLGGLAIGGIVVGCVAAAGLVLGLFLLRRRSKKKTLTIDSDIGGFGGANGSTL